MKRMVTVSQEDIDLGIPASSWACAIVMALRRKFPTMEASVVPITDAEGTVQHMATLHEYVGGVQPARALRHVFSLSKNASTWIHGFDKTGSAVPATFEMTAIEFERSNP